ncbi:MAG: hypothetical protein KC449_28980, partial [Anaerolineales bacterium]|nr:hypothetical protein [Anaerolineales bacterium]
PRPVLICLGFFGGNGRTHSTPILQARAIDQIGRITTPPQAYSGNGRTHSTPILQAKAIGHHWED